MMDYSIISKEYNKLQNGAAKMEAIKKAIYDADLEKNYECAVRFRYDYIYQAVFYDDVFKAFVIFPEYLNVFDKHYDEIDYQRKDIILLYPYMWLIQDSVLFYQISNEKVIEYLEDFKERLIKRGFSLRAYYISFAYYIEDIDEEEYKKAFKEYLNSEKDEFMSSKGEIFDKIYFEMFYGDFNESMKLAQPILANKLKYGDYLECLYNNIIIHYINNNSVKENIDEVTKYKDLLYKEMSKSISSLRFVDTIIKYYVIVDLNKGLKFFKNYLDWNLKVKNPRAKFNFELAAYRLFRALKEKENKKTIKLNLDSKFKLYKENGVYQIDELINYFKENCIYIAEKFDNKNKNDNYMKKFMNDSFLN